MRVCILLLVALLSVQAGDAPADDLPLRGSGRFTYYLFKVYDVRCYAPAGLAADAVLGEQPRRLTFAYLRDCTAKELADATTSCVDERRGKAPKAEIDTGLAAINALWPSVVEGDVLGLAYRPGTGTTVSLNGRDLGTVPGAAFAQVLFAIWLGAEPIDGGLRKKLLGDQVTSRSATPLPWKRRLVAWFDTHAAGMEGRDDEHRVDWLRTLPFIALHLACLLVFVVGVSPVAVAVCAAFFVLRMFAITAVYHRLLAHRAYQAPRWLAFLGALVASSSGQRGPLWWAAHHRLHHRHSDLTPDLHSPQRGFWRAHLLWFMTPGAFRTRQEAIPDLADRRELVFLDRFDSLAPLLLALSCFALGEALRRWAPGLGCDGWQLAVWGFAVSTVLLAHATFTVNSLCHVWGSRPYATSDDSRNNWLIAIVTLGEGWHNNHHRYPASVRQGFRWWQYDPTWWALRAAAACGLVSDLKPLPARVLAEGRQKARP